MSKNRNLKETIPSYNQKFSTQSFWDKIFGKRTEKSSKSGQDKKSLISTFACFQLLSPKFNF